MKKELSEGRADLISGNVLLSAACQWAEKPENVRPHLLPSRVPRDQHSGHAVGSGKKEAANQGTTNHRRGFPVSKISRERARAGACMHT